MAALYNDDVSQILPNLFLGNRNAAKEFPCDVMVSAMEEDEYEDYLVVDRPNVEWHRFLVEDSNEFEISEIFGSVHSILQSALKQNRRVLVHCVGGISRSPTLVAAFLMMEHGWTRRQAIEFISKRRLGICPNDGFQNQLKSLEIRIALESAAKLE